MQMQFGDFIFVKNPANLKLIYSKNMNLINIPDWGTFSQNLGPAARIVRGEGVFAGESAWLEFENLVVLFESNKNSRLLVLPNGQMFFCHFSRLEMVGEGGKNGLSYQFEFVEDAIKEARGSKPKLEKYVTQEGDTLTQIALKNNVGIDKIMMKNPLLKRKIQLEPGQEVLL